MFFPHNLDSERDVTAVDMNMMNKVQQSIKNLTEKVIFSMQICFYF